MPSFRVASFSGLTLSPTTRSLKSWSSTWRICFSLAAGSVPNVVPTARIVGSSGRPISNGPLAGVVAAIFSANSVPGLTERHPLI